MTENTKTLLRHLVHEREIVVDLVADRTGLSIDEIRAAAIASWFDITDFMNEDVPVLIQLNPEGYRVARQLLRSKGSGAVS